MKKILVLNGPNINLLGKRNPEVYGNTNFSDLMIAIKNEFSSKAELVFFQSNVEGELVNKIHEVGFSYEGIIFNPGAYTHTSIALHDAIESIATPVIEVHISNVYAREEFRHKSFVSPVALGSIIGLGTKGYSLAIEKILEL